MRKSSIALVLLALSISTAVPFIAAPNVLGSHLAYDVRNCTAAGQGPNCDKVFYEGNLGFTFIQTWDPAWDYETYAGSLLGGVLYDMPVIYANASVTSLVPTSAIKSIVNQNGTYYEFQINSGIHARELTSGGVQDLGAITANDWAYAFQRSLAVCEPDGPAPVVYQFIYGASDWFYGPNNCLDNAGNSTALNLAWTALMALNPIQALDSTHFAIKVDADLNSTNGQQPYTPFLGVLANSWAVVYPQATVDAKCGTLTSNLAKTCPFMDSAKSIGTGPYLYDESNTNPDQIVLRKNVNYCEGDRAATSECDKVGAVTQANRVNTIIITQVAEETTRSSALNTGTYDHSVLAPTSYPQFLQAGTTPPYNALQPSLASEYQFTIVPSLTVQHEQLLVHRTAAQHTSYGVSPLEGDCPGSPGCLVRQAIRTVFNYNNYMQNIVLGLGTQLSTFMPDPFPDGNTAAQANGVPLVTTSTTQAVVYLLAAGYHNTNKLAATQQIQCAYNVGNDARSRSCISLANSLDALRTCNNLLTCGNTTSNPRFDATCHVADATHSGSCTIVASPGGSSGIAVVAPPSGYLAHVDDRAFDIAGLGWFPDYVTEDDYARPYAHSGGTFMLAIGYDNATLDNEIDTAAGMQQSPARQALYFDAEKTINNDCQCYIWLNQPSGRSIWIGGGTNGGINTASLFQRLVNPAFLPYYLDIQKTLFVPTSTPVFPSIIGAFISAAIALGAAVLLRRTSTRRNLGKYA